MRQYNVLFGGLNMRKFSNFLAALAALAVCGLMTWLTLDSGTYTVLYNLAVLGVMLFIIFLAFVIGFRRMGQTVKGLDNASKKLVSVYQNRADMSEITQAGVSIFSVQYLDKKYQAQLGAYIKAFKATTGENADARAYHIDV